MDNKEKHFTASALIVHNKKVLLVNHLKLGVWLYPGGHVEKDENPDQTLIREVKEETGLDVEIISQKDDCFSDIAADVCSLHIPYAVLCELVGNHYHNDLIYLCRVVGDCNNLVYKTDESDGINFFSKDELENIKLFPNFRKLLEKLFEDIPKFFN
ncbi:MAG TPA: NUDIX domain-containing protein [bacterium]|nr:NUDIX domain-containing protein [bacterium]